MLKMKWSEKCIVLIKYFFSFNKDVVFILVNVYLCVIFSRVNNCNFINGKIVDFCRLRC